MTRYPDELPVFEVRRADHPFAHVEVGVCCIDWDEFCHLRALFPDGTEGYLDTRDARPLTRAAREAWEFVRAAQQAAARAR